MSKNARDSHTSKSQVTRVQPTEDSRYDVRKLPKNSGSVQGEWKELFEVVSTSADTIKGQRKAKPLAWYRSKRGRSEVRCVG